MGTEPVGGNAEAIEAWNTVLFDKFIRFRDVLSKGLGDHGTRGIELLAPAAGARIVDIGCGFGDTTLELAERVGQTGSVVGLDAAPKFIELAATEAAGRTNVSYEVADVESTVPGGPYDAAFSRMGTMFFMQPVFALRNIRKALKPGGTLMMVVWRKKDASPCFYEPEMAVREILGDPPKNDAVTCGPGPFSMGSTDLTSDLLVAAGFTNISFTRSDADIVTGKSLSDAVEFSLTMGPAGEVVRLAADEGVRRRAEIEAALTKLFAPHQRPDGSVHVSASAWLVSAQAPR